MIPAPSRLGFARRPRRLFSAISAVNISSPSGKQGGICHPEAGAFCPPESLHRGEDEVTYVTRPLRYNLSAHEPPPLRFNRLSSAGQRKRSIHPWLHP